MGASRGAFTLMLRHLGHSSYWLVQDAARDASTVNRACPREKSERVRVVVHHAREMRQMGRARGQGWTCSWTRPWTCSWTHPWTHPWTRPWKQTLGPAINDPVQHNYISYVAGGNRAISHVVIMLLRSRGGSRVGPAADLAKGRPRSRSMVRSVGIFDGTSRVCMGCANPK